MSTPKPIGRNHSFAFRRDFSQKRVSSGDRNFRESDELVRKRFKIQPYSSFEDKFLEQDRLNQYIFEQFQKLESKISVFSQNELEKQEIFNNFLIIEQKIAGIFTDLQISKQISQDFLELKETLTQQLSQESTFKEKSSKKNKVLFEEVVRLGKTVEATERKVEDLKKKSVKPGKVRVITENIEGIDDKLNSIESTFSTLKSSIESESIKIQKLSQSTHSLRQDIESYISHLNNSLSSSLSKSSETMVKKLLDEQETRQQNTIDLKHLIELQSNKLNEKFSSELLSLQKNLQKLDSHLLLQKHEMEDFQKTFLTILQTEKKEIKDLIFSSNSQILDLESKLQKSFNSLENMQKTSLETISSTILAEIQTRVHSEHELQNMIKVTNKGIFEEMTRLQNEVNELASHFKIITADIRASISEKCDLLSRFVESEIQKVNQKISSNMKKYKTAIPRETDAKLQELKEQFLQIFSKIQQDSLNRFKSYSQNQEKISAKLKELSEETNENLEKILKESEKNFLFFQENLVKLDEKVMKIDENSYNDLTSLVGLCNELQEDLQEIRADKDFYSEIIAGLEAQIEVKVANEKVSREHMVTFYIQSIQEEISHLHSKTSKKLQIFSKNFVKIEEIPEILAKIDSNKQNFLELSKTFDSYKENINSEIKEYYEQITIIEEKADIASMIVEEMKERVKDILENHSKFGMMLRSVMKEHDKERRFGESKNILNDMTNRVETMGILSKLDEILIDMDANERETQAMLTLYKRELEYLQDKQKKGLDDAQNAVKSIFDTKISGLQKMVSDEMTKIIDFIKTNQVISPNLSSLQEYASSLKLVP
jgi:hypothetical protein